MSHKELGDRVRRKGGWKGGIGRPAWFGGSGYLYVTVGPVIINPSRRASLRGRPKPTCAVLLVIAPFDYRDRRQFLDRERYHVVAKVLVTVDVHSLKIGRFVDWGIE